MEWWFSRDAYNDRGLEGGAEKFCGAGFLLSRFDGSIEVEDGREVVVERVFAARHDWAMKFWDFVEWVSVCPVVVVLVKF